jgi:NAD(P)-dependent dehydrogenase (short-subunit alcohol dehydrogenase family)
MKTVLVTAANKGIGREVARQLAGKGFYVFVGAQNGEAGRKAAPTDQLSAVARACCCRCLYTETYFFAHKYYPTRIGYLQFKGILQGFDK